MVRKQAAMHVDTIRRRHGKHVYESFLVRRSVREGTRVRKETVANISGLPPEAIEAVRRVLRGEALGATGEAFRIERSLPHGHVAAMLGRCAGSGSSGSSGGSEAGSATWRWRSSASGCCGRARSSRPAASFR
jgi:hypothetical protein